MCNVDVYLQSTRLYWQFNITSLSKMLQVIKFLHTPRLFETYSPQYSHYLVSTEGVNYLKLIGIDTQGIYSFQPITYSHLTPVRCKLYAILRQFNFMVRQEELYYQYTVTEDSDIISMLGDTQLVTPGGK